MALKQTINAEAKNRLKGIIGYAGIQVQLIDGLPPTQWEKR